MFDQPVVSIVGNGDVSFSFSLFFFVFYEKICYVRNGMEDDDDDDDLFQAIEKSFKFLLHVEIVV